MDEDMLTGRILRNKNLIWVAGASQQPPMFTYIYWNILRLGGANIFNARAISVLFGVCSFPLFYLLLVRIGVKPLMGAIGSVALLLDPLFLQLAREVRPYTTGLFFMLVYLLILTEPTNNSSFKNRLLRLFLANLLFLFSLGVQPILISFSAATAYAFVVRKAEPRCSLLPLAALGLALLLFSPFQWAMWPTYSQSLSENFLHPISALYRGVEAVYKIGPTLFGPLCFALPLILAALALGWREKHNRTPLLLFLLLPLASLVLYIFFLGNIIDYMQRDRYLALFKVIALIGIFSAACLIYEKGKLAKIGVSALLIGLLINLLSTTRPPIFGEIKWRAFFTYLESTKATNAAAFVFSVSPPNVIEFSGFVGTDFYSTQKHREKVNLQSAWNEIGERSQASAIYSALASKLEPAEIILYDLNLEGSKRIDQYKLSNVMETSVLEPTLKLAPVVLRVKNVGGLTATFERLLKEMESQESTEILRFRIYLALAGLRAFQHRCSEARKYWLRADSIPGRPARLHDPQRELRLVERCESASQQGSL